MRSYRVRIYNHILGVRSVFGIFSFSIYWRWLQQENESEKCHNISSSLWLCMYLFIISAHKPRIWNRNRQAKNRIIGREDDRQGGKGGGGYERESKRIKHVGVNHKFAYEILKCWRWQIHTIHAWPRHIVEQWVCSKFAHDTVVNIYAPFYGWLLLLFGTRNAMVYVWT